MATDLPTDIDSTFPDRDPGDAQHQRHHDALHAYTNGHDTATDPHGDRAYANSTALIRSEVQTGYVHAPETTTSTSFTDLATVGPSVTVNVGASGRVLIILGGRVDNSAAGNWSLMGVSTDLVGPSDSVSYVNVGVDESTASHVVIAAGYPAGPRTFTVKYRVTAGTGTFQFRRITAIPL